MKCAERRQKEVDKTNKMFYCIKETIQQDMRKVGKKMDAAQLNTSVWEKPAPARKKGISGSTIKIIAVVAMLIDHIAAALLTRMLLIRGFNTIMYSNDFEKITQWVIENAALYYSVMLMRMVGRLGFPIFCFLLVQGFQKTRSVKKYAMRMALFALISEIPFDLAISGTVMDFGYQNVYFTLLLGLLALCAIDWLAKQKFLPAVQWLLLAVGVAAPTVYVLMMYWNAFTVLRIAVVVCVAAVTVVALIRFLVKKGVTQTSQIFAGVAAAVVAMVIADLLRTDYSGMGVLTIVAMYVFREKKVISMLSGCIVLSLMSLSELPAFLTLIPIALYNGERGLKMKYFFYAFYPVHLFLIWLIAALMGMGNIPAV